MLAFRGLVVALFIMLWVAAFAGWLVNIAKIFMTLADPISGLFIARLVGVFAMPLGSVLGYF